MILDKEVEIKTNSSTYYYYINLGYKFKCGDKIFIKIEDLQKNSHEKINVMCDICGKESLIKFQSYNTSFKNGNLYSCKNCSFEKVKSTMFEKYGVEHALQNSIIKEKQEKSCLKKFGFKNVSKNDNIKNKKTETFLKNYGVNNPSQMSDYNVKVKKTKLEKYGNENYTNREQAKQTCLKIFGCENPSQLSEIKIKKEKTCMKNWGVKSPQQNSDVFERTKKTSLKFKRHKQTDLLYQAKNELHFLDYCVQNNIKIEKSKSIRYEFENKKKFYHPDFYLKSYNLIIEIKSIYTYNKELNKNLAKQKACLEQGYNFIFIIDKDYNEFKNLFLNI